MNFLPDDLRVVHNESPSQDRLWTVGAAPRLVIGDEPGEELFRVGTPRILRNNVIVFANAGSSELLFYGLDGGLVKVRASLSEASVH